MSDKSTSFGSLVFVAFIGFLLGRATSGDQATPNMADDTSQTEELMVKPAKSDSAPLPAKPGRLLEANTQDQVPTYSRPSQSQEQTNDVYYRNCSAARAAGAAPVYAGDPGYARKLDRDGDGVGCE